MESKNMKYLKNDGTPDKRYNENKVPNVIESSKPLPTKNGYVQFEFRPISIVNGVVTNKLN